MKKFRFHLEKLLSYKDQLLNSEMMTLGILQNELKDAQDKVSALEAQLTQCKLKFQEEMTGNVTPAACQLHLNYIEHLKVQIKEAHKEVDLLTEKVDRQIETVKALKLDSKSLESIKDSRFEEYQKEGQKKFEAQIEEFVVTSKIMGTAMGEF